MAATITLFASNTAPTGKELDDNFTSYTTLGMIPCAVAGTNTLTLTPFNGSAAATPAITAYQNYLSFSGVVAISNSGATTIQVGSLAALPCYKDTALGPTALSGGELIANCAFTALYDSTLNSGNGGFHVTTGPNTVGATLNVTELISTKILVGSSTASITRILTGSATLSYSVTPAGATQDQTFTLTGALAGDAVQVGFISQPPAGAGFTGFMAAAGTVSLRLINPASVTLGAASLTVNAITMGTT
jgi:hypothetical protein